MDHGIIILGAGHAGTAAAAAIRGAGYAGRLVMIGDDPHLPYERPPLSKDVLRDGDAAVPTIYPADFYAARDIALRRGIAATAIDPQVQTVTLADGAILPFDRLLIATGARARRYPLLDALGDKAHVLRDLADARRLRRELVAGRDLLVVGGGVIGLEVAATARTLGLSVQVIERAPRILERGAPEPLARILGAAHAAHGVGLHTGVDLVHASRASDRVFLDAADGRRFSGDLVVYGIGVTLNDELARAAGIHLDDGIVVDALGRTSHPAIHAAGDIARQFHGFIGGPARQETWANAMSQGAAVGQAMVTGRIMGEDVPCYWTDQFGVNYQIAGRPRAERWITRNGPDLAPRLLFGLQQGVLVGTVGIDAGADMRQARAWIAQGAMPDPALLADPAQPLRAMAAAMRPG